MKWTDDLSTGISVIDKQHMRIIDYINELEDSQKNHDREKVSKILGDLIDYTLSHFAFEESLQEEAGYQYSKPHKKVHELFARRVSEYSERFKLGDDVSEEVHGLLRSWLINHIKQDDMDYVGVVRNYMSAINKNTESRNEHGWLRRFFG
ncbi:hypothetical protein BI364_07415 [Acidihalobacter yilgarnensis]|uniref:Hemerythrin-like domain-containing protein n=1 Tax=Acidihalobacter yilgarnensis TaxID=2819280 RepID=A0A1D8ISW9_9GAMM|nr:hypothetical protein BI364_07415 [Acidihalobacter yilgarnensis]